MVGKLSILIRIKDAKLGKSYSQMFFSMLLKGLSMIITFASVPVILKFVSYEIYGVYLALTSSFALINIMDIGLGDGLRNKFAESRTTGDTEMAKAYVSTTYFTNFVLTTIIVVSYFILEPFVNWNNFLNISTPYNDLKLVARILIIATAIKFFLQAILNMLKGDQKYITFSVIGFSLNLVSILLVFLLYKLNIEGNLIYLVGAFFVIPNLILLGVNIVYFSKSYAEFSPNFRHIKKTILKSLSSLSLKFFMVNIMGVIALQSINIIVIRYFDPALVVDFNLLFKYYFLVISISFILFNPIWSTFTEAVVKKDLQWTKRLLKRSLQISVMLSLILPFMIIFSNDFISLWSGHLFTSSITLNILFGIWVVLNIVSEPYKMLLKGSGELNSYVVVSVLFTLIQLLISLVLIEVFDFALTAILLGCVLSQSLYLGFFYVKSKNILSNFKGEDA